MTIDHLKAVFFSLLPLAMLIFGLVSGNMPCVPISQSRNNDPKRFWMVGLLWAMLFMTEIYYAVKNW